MPEAASDDAAALLHYESPIQMPIAAAMDRLAELNVLTETDSLGVSEQAALLEFSTSDFSAMGYGTMSPHMVPESPRLSASDLVGLDLATPGKTGKKRAAPSPLETAMNAIGNKAFKLNPQEDYPFKVKPLEDPPRPMLLTSRAVRQSSEEIFDRLANPPSERRGVRASIISSAMVPGSMIDVNTLSTRGSLTMVARNHAPNWVNHERMHA
eukprot:CAMPEP_0174701708 /NCGR_PEP_ID=MMETSP1094-20130205/6258_1 /TAXON_ID=156173 /ORGANISM="Chrysochromulina brevifilum, Strain UTEX LB 985" /LENGTH=210 /DNA_ID=CAMNT_0015899393 /DNA_START=29 /DNA_END=663 /DNA_ORIENTATION=-